MYAYMRVKLWRGASCTLLWPTSNCLLCSLLHREVQASVELKDRKVRTEPKVYRVLLVKEGGKARQEIGCVLQKCALN